MALSRRSFLQTLMLGVGAIVTGVVVVKPETVDSEWEQMKQYVAPYRGRQFIETGVVYAPYIPICMNRYGSELQPEDVERLNRYVKRHRITA